MLTEYIDRYTKESTRKTIAETLLTLARWRGDADPLTLGSTEIARWLATARANNTARKRLSTLRMFFRWAVRKGLVQENPTDDLEHLAKTFPVTYGKVQSKNPARFLTHDEAYRLLVGVCQDGTDKGLRDEVAIRLGLAGIRASEVTNLTVREIDLERPWISYTGKDNVPRDVKPGKKLVALIADYLDAWEKATGRPPAPHACLLSAVRNGGADKALNNELLWGVPIRAVAFHRLVVRRAQQAGIGHVTPHDLRRTCCAILHNAKSKDGGHIFDLRDIQKALNHSSPAMTERYLNQLDTQAIETAADYLD